MHDFSFPLSRCSQEVKTEEMGRQLAAAMATVQRMSETVDAHGSHTQCHHRQVCGHSALSMPL